MSEKPDIAAEIARAPQPLNLVRHDAARTALAELRHINEILEIHPGDVLVCVNR